MCDRVEHPCTHPHSLLYVLHCENSFLHMAVRMAMSIHSEKSTSRHGRAHSHAKSARKTCNQAWPCAWPCLNLDKTELQDTHGYAHGHVCPGHLKKKISNFFPHKAVIVNMLLHFPKSFHFPIPFLFPILRVCEF